MKRLFLLFLIVCSASMVGCSDRLIENAYTDISVEELEGSVGDTVDEDKQEGIIDYDEDTVNENKDSQDKRDDSISSVENIINKNEDSQDKQNDNNDDNTVFIDDTTITVKESNDEEVNVTFEEVDEVVYAVSEVNVREGCGTNYNKICTLTRGESLQRVGIGDNGWSKVVYNGSKVYVSSKYLSTEKPKSQAEYDIDDRGAYGRLSIPDVGIDVALFYTTGKSAEYSQKLVDGSDSAAFIGATSIGWTRNIVADHKHQGFSGIKKAVPDSTLAYIDYGSYKETYMCVSKFNGTNTGSELLDDKGNNVKNGTEGDLIMYTCNSNWKDVTVTYWKKM